MNKTEYLNKKKALSRKHENENKDLAKEFVLANARAEIGDVVTDHIGNVKVEMITPAMGFGNQWPEGVYHGTQYTKTGNPFKSGDKRNVWGGNIVSVLKS